MLRSLENILNKYKQEIKDQLSILRQNKACHQKNHFHLTTYVEYSIVTTFIVIQVSQLAKLETT